MEMNLPELPKKNNQREAKFGLMFRKWWEKNPRRGTFEIKYAGSNNNLKFSEVKDKQLNFGRVVSSERGVLIRLHPFVEGTPDYGGYRNDPSYIVIKYKDFFCLISVETFLLESKRSKRRSLTASRAKEIAT